MFFLSPEKLFVVLVVAVIVLGPERLPRVARQVSGTWRAVTALRSRLEEQAHATFPDMPDLGSLARNMRSPLTYLDHLTDADRPPGAGEGHPAPVEPEVVRPMTVTGSVPPTPSAADPALN